VSGAWKPVLLLLATQQLMAQDAAQLIARAAANARRSLEARLSYTYMARQEVRRHDSSGNPKSTEVTVTEVVSMHGAPIARPISFNGGAPTPRQQRVYADAVSRLGSRPREESDRRRSAALKNFAFFDELADGMRFRLLREENLNGRTTYVIEAVPAPGYRPRTSQAKFLAKVRANVWIDKQAMQCRKLEATFIEACSVASLFARVQPGSRVLLDQTEVAPALWMPARLELKAEAKLLLLVGYNLDSTTTFSDYRPVNATSSLLVGAR
jgi:hypothetical protein